MKFKSRIYKNIIIEGQREHLLEKQDYYDMFNDVIKLYSIVRDLMGELENLEDDMFVSMLNNTVGIRLDRAIKLDIENTKKKAVRTINGQERAAPDMAIWILRHLKLVDYYRILNNANQILTFVEEEESPQVVTLARRVRSVAVETLNKYVGKLRKVHANFAEFAIENEEDEDEVIRLDKKLDEIKKWINNRLLGHYTGMVHVGQIQNYRFENQWWGEIEEYMKAAEDLWKEEMEAMKNFAPMEQLSTSKVLLEFPDGKFWLDLQVPYCDQEGRMLGHCGNRPGHKKDDKVLSFRSQGEMKGKKVMKAHLTFILHGDGTLGERKGRGNTKPKPEYHPYIVELLKQPYVKKIGSGIYLPGNDFNLKDLNPELTMELMLARPEFYGLDAEQAKTEVQKIQAKLNGQPLVAESRRRR